MLIIRMKAMVIFKMMMLTMMSWSKMLISMTITCSPSMTPSQKRMMMKIIKAAHPGITSQKLVNMAKMEKLIMIMMVKMVEAAHSGVTFQKLAWKIQEYVGMMGVFVRGDKYFFGGILEGVLRYLGGV